MNHYFLIASLPTLILDEKLPMLSEEFLETCEESSVDLDTTAIRYILDEEPEKADHPFIQKWLQGEIELRNAIARSRAAKTNVDAEPFLKDTESFDSYTEKFVPEAMNQPNPLERELALDRFRWKTIEDLALFEPFGISAVFAYALKFKLVKRWSELKEEKGEAVVQTFVKQVLTEDDHE